MKKLKISANKSQLASIGICEDVSDYQFKWNKTFPDGWFEIEVTNKKQTHWLQQYPITYDIPSSWVETV